MAHLVDKIKGEDSMAYVGALPWHGLGQKLEEGASIETWSAKAHLDWGVEETVVQYNIPGFRETPIAMDFSNQKVLYRTDSSQPLAIVGKGYKVVQPADILEFYRELVDNYGWNIHTAGSLDNGRRVWALAKMNESFVIGSDDAIHQFALLATSYDKTLSTTFMPTSVRVVCNNTLSYAYDRTGAGMVKIPHYKKFDPSLVKLEAGLLDDTFGQFGEKAQVMADTYMSDDQSVKFFMNLMHDDRMGEDFTDVMVDGPKVKAIDGMIDKLAEGDGSELETSINTLWGVLNAVTAWVDHEKPARSINNRFKGGQFGPGAAIKKAAWDAATGIIEKRESIAA